MVKRSLLFLLVLALCSPCDAGMIIRGSDGASCATQSTDQQSTSYDSSYEAYGSFTDGQSYIAGVSGPVHSIIIYAAGVAGGSSGQWKARIGESEDLSSVYLGETTPLDIIYDDGSYEYQLIFPSATRPSQTATNTYYIAIMNTASTYSNRGYINVATVGTYSNGQAWTGTTWNMTGGGNAGDLYFKIKVCNP